MRPILSVLTATFALSLISFSVRAEVSIVDGDTFDLDDVRIRLNGIDAPEVGQHCGSWDCGAASLAALDQLIHSGTVECKSLGNDGYGRVIAKCTVLGKDIGESLVLEGLAYAFVKYSIDYVEAEETARIIGLGIWQADYQRPWDFRAEKWKNAEQEAPNGCPIKGNISDNGKIYHAPWSPWYKKTRIDESKGEHWFCSEAEAVAAGWRAPRWR